MRKKRKRYIFCRALSLLFCLTAFSNAKAITTATMGDAYRYCNRKGIKTIYVEAIAEIESVKKEGYPLGYPYAIRLNNSNVRIRGLKRLTKYGNVYDCINANICKMVSEKLIKKGIRNFDMGVFQINYYYNKGINDVIERSFLVPESFKIVCDILNERMKLRKDKILATATYHSFRKKRMISYARKIKKILRRKMSKKQYVTYYKKPTMVERVKRESEQRLFDIYR